MDINQLKHIINNGETETVEFKLSFNKDVIESISAFANTKGGAVYIGINEKNGKITGVDISKESIQNWINEIKTKTEPSIIPDTDIFKFDNKIIVEISVKEYPIKPVACKNRYFIRKQNSNHTLTTNGISDLHLLSLQESWDGYNFPNAKTSDLSAEKIQKFIEETNNTGRFSLVKDYLVSLRKLSLLKNNKPTIASILLFAKIPERHHIRIGRFKSASTIIDDRQITNTLFEQATKSLIFIKNYIKIEYLFDGSIKRKERWEYPVQAIKESLLNAIIHRDYRENNDIQIKIFDDKITIYSPGQLFGGITTQELKTDNYQSSLRNKLIAEAFYLIGEIEKYGTGFIRIRDYLKDYPEIEFSFEQLKGGMLVTYAKKTAQKTAQKTTKEKIVDLLIENPKYTKQDLMEILNKADGTIKEHLYDLQKQNTIKRIGGRKNGYWDVIKNTE